MPNYTMKTNIPQYEPKNTPPTLSQCINVDKYKQLKEKILNSNVSKIEKQFLLASATRHYVFNYSKIADYYASASKEMQELMEDSALVIIDFDDAIAKGYVNLNIRINDIIDRRMNENEK